MEWRSAIKWIINTGVPLNDTHPVETLLEFQNSLRDGVILCRILDVMKPGCIEYSSNIKNADLDEFSCQINISSFLQTCQEEFFIEEEKLFFMDDLYDLLDFRKVLGTLSVLSQTFEATEIHHWDTFDVLISEERNLDTSDEVNQFVHRIGVLPPKQIKDELLETERLCTSTFYVSLNLKDESDKFHLLNEDAGSLADQSSELPQSPAGFDSSVKEVEQPEPDIILYSKTEYIILEILEKEESYLNQLQTLVHVYIPTLTIYLTKEEREKIFLNLEDIHRLHLSFYGHLKTQKDLGDISIDFLLFLRYKKRFLIYAYYCSFLKESRSVIECLSKYNTAFREAVTDLNERQNQSISLWGFLSICFQQIVRYPMLLERLKDSVSRDQKDWPEVDQALVAMKDVARYVERYKSDMPNIKKLKQIKDTLQFNNSVKVPHSFGRPVQNGRVKITYLENNKQTHCFAFLFEHVLLMCKAQGKDYQVKDVLQLNLLATEKVDCNSFKLTDQTSNETFLLDVRNDKLATIWMESLEKCMNITDEVNIKCENSNHIHVLKLTTFDENDCECCGVCGLLLMGLIDQGYLCEECQLRVHETCIQFSQKYHGLFPVA